MSRLKVNAAREGVGSGRKRKQQQQTSTTYPTPEENDNNNNKKKKKEREKERDKLQLVKHQPHPSLSLYLKALMCISVPQKTGSKKKKILEGPENRRSAVRRAKHIRATMHQRRFEGPLENAVKIIIISPTTTVQVE
eukprot:gene1337-778_t